VARKIVKVYLTPQQKNILEKVCYSLGMGESDVLRYSFLEFAKSISLITENVHGRKTL
jgi:hypothetical protein